MHELVIKGRAAKLAAQVLSQTSSELRSSALLTMADFIEDRSEQILRSNELDLNKALHANNSPALLDRLTLTPNRISDLASGLRQVAVLTEPLSEVMDIITRPNGLTIHKVRVPLGVVGVIYEARPNVTSDVAALCLKSGNAVVLRGSSSALHSNQVLTQVIQSALLQVGLPAESVQLIEDPAREATDAMLRMHEYLDVLIPRGGQGLISHVMKNSTVPVLQTGAGNCHIFIDASAQLSMAIEIVLNAKVQRPGVCNAVETLLIHEAWAKDYLPYLLETLQSKGVDIRGCEKTCALHSGLCVALQTDWETEYLDLRLAVKLVPTLTDAMEHIRTYSTGHSECIISEDTHNSTEFLQLVDAAVVYHNASTRFTDGYEFGLGAEIGISTQKLHARGPMGLKELTSYKYKVYGKGQIR